MDSQPAITSTAPNWLSRILSLNKLLTPARRRYPWFIGIALWSAWLISLFLGQLQTRMGPTDRFGKLFGTDFVAFYTAGRIIDSGQSADLYDLTTAHEIQQEIYQVDSQNFNPYLNPPFYALLFTPLSRLPYNTAAALWMGFNLACLWLSFRILSPEGGQRKFWLALTWLPAWSAITFGQNAFLSLFILSSTYVLWSRKHYLLAGIAAGLMLYKPQLAIGIGLLWLIDTRQSWKSLAGMATSGFGLVFISAFFLPEASTAYLRYAYQINANLMTFEGFPIWNAHGLQTFFLGMLPNFQLAARVLYFVCASAGLFAFYHFSKQHESTPLRFTAAICLTLWVTPYVMIYDWSILLIPAILIWTKLPHLRPYWEVLFAILWVVMFLSTPLTAAQLQLFGAAAQISVPALAIVLATAMQILKSHPVFPTMNA